MKTAFITGASSGLGAEFAAQLAAQGYDLIISARREERLEQLAQVLSEQHGVKISSKPADLSKMPDIERMVSIINGLPRLDLLVNNAGFGTVGRFVHVLPEKELAMMHLHMIAPVMLCRAALPGMLARNQGAIINISSVSGLIPIRNVVYQSTKSFLVNFSAALSKELVSSQVRIQVLCPGFVKTEFHDTPEYAHFSRAAIPEFLWMTATQVVCASLKSLEGKQLVCIPGTIYRFADALARNSLTGAMLRLAAQFILSKRRTYIPNQ